MIPLKKVKLDSFRLLVPFENVKILDSTLESKVVAKILDTGEIEELEHQEVKSTIFKTITGINFRFAIHTFFNEDKELQKYLALIVNAKMLKEKYFEGITKDNIQTIFHFINSTGVIEIDKENFLNAKVVDTDICVDILLKNTTCKQFVQMANQIAIPKKDIAVIPYLQAKNTGIQFGHRLGVGKSYIKKQFLKYYAKLVSLKYDEKNIEFYETYIKQNLFKPTLFSNQESYKIPFNDENLLRMETTIKNKHHWQSYGKNVSTLKDLLQLDISKDYSYFKRPQINYMNIFKNIEHNTEETLTDKTYLFLMKSQAQIYAMDIQETIPFIVNSLYPSNPNDKSLKQKRYNLKKKLLNLALNYKAEVLKSKNKINKANQLEFENFNLIPKT